ncbi:MAG TPA: triose-phosphate isomerase [Gemmatimonadales bacterium]|nr:triose-phosphate isomerase [Gemmatimonadales bacterium]
MRKLLFAANWKMHLGPADTRSYCATFLSRMTPMPGREVWFFPPSPSLEAAASALAGRVDIRVGAQDIHWEAKGAFTGAVSAGIVAQAGARATLVGHSERRKLFGETDADTAKKVRAALAAGLTPMLCVGEELKEREAGNTLSVVTRQLTAALDGLSDAELERIVLAYEPVWAIGTGRNATPQDAGTVHREIRRWVTGRGATRPQILYGGSVNLGNIAALLAEPEIDGVLVGGASLEPDAWAQLVRTGAP